MLTILYFFQILNNMTEMNPSEFVECSQAIKEENDEVETKISLEKDPLQFNPQDEQHENKVRKIVDNEQDQKKDKKMC